MKKKVVVIDDKPIIRKSIVHTMNWERLGCEVIGQAEDGLAGERLILDLRPDILITDIKMPGHDGLHLAELMQANLPRSKTILITGYQEFENAQRAVRLGVFDFIVKPIRNEELYNVVESAVREIEEAACEKQAVERLSREYNELEQRHNSTIPSLRSKWITDRIGGKKAESADFRPVLKELGIHCSRYSMIAVRLTRSGVSEREPAAASFLGQIAESVKSAINKDEIDIIEAEWNEDLLFVCLFPRVPTTREARTRLQALASEWLACIHRQSGEHCRIAVGTLRKSLGELDEAYREVKGLLESSFFRGDEPILHPDPNPAAKESGKFSIMQDLEQFNRMLEQSSSDEIVQCMERLLDQIRVYSEGNILVVKGLLSEVCLATARYYFRLTGDEVGLGKSVDQILDDIFRLGSFKEAAEYLASFIGSVKRKAEGGDKEYSLIVKKAVDYINSRFAEAINLTSVADHLGISPSYLSRLLRTETGINFVDLVSKARIEAAKRLLRDPKHKVNEVGEMVGYKEYAYFYQVFKRIEGQSPKEFKNRSKEN